MHVCKFVYKLCMYCMYSNVCINIYIGAYQVYAID